ncbi:cutinase family protein [Arthrobacter sp. UYCo732]|uniref:cutinase family protein n=1 Tax=Arthrobacter sp. UYCo732 TaxID=3156336 RepID=UPI003391C6D3
MTYQTSSGPEAFRNADPYRTAIESGSKALIQTLAELASCRDSKVVVMGFGQGAEVAHTAASQLDQSTTGHVASFWLISDPARKTTESVTSYLEGPWIGEDKKIASTGGVHAGSSGTISLPDDKVISVCHPTDDVCHNYSKRPDNLQWQNHRGIYSSDSDPAKMHDTPARYVVAKLGYPEKLPVPGELKFSDGGATVVVDSGDAEPLGRGGVQKTSDKCEADVVVIGARGSYESLTEGAQQGQNYDPSRSFLRGFGTPVSLAAEKLRTTLSPEIKVRFIHVPYEAVRADYAFAPERLRELNQDLIYTNSVNSGVVKATLLISELLEKCPDTKIVLMGYSQGAQTIHKALLQMDKRTYQAVAAVELIADPMRDSTDLATTNLLGVPTDVPIPLVPEDIAGVPVAFPFGGIRSYYGEDGSSPGDPKLATVSYGPLGTLAANNGKFGRFDVKLSGKILHYCNPLDFVCNGHLPDAHGSAYHAPDAHGTSAGWVAGRVVEALKTPNLGATVLSEDKTCRADVAILGLRGSADSLNSGSIEGFGPTVSASAEGLIKQLPATTKVRLIPVGGPTEPRKFVPYAGPEYFDALKSLADQVSKTVDAQLTACPQTRIVAIGFDIGAVALHNAIPEMPVAQRNQFAGVWMIGDGSRARSENPHIKVGVTAEAGSVLESAGGDDFVTRDTFAIDAPMAISPAFPADLKNKVVTVCALLDSTCHGSNSVCDGNTKECRDLHGFPKTADTPEEFAAGQELHRTGYALPEYVDYPAYWMAEQVKAAMKGETREYHPGFEPPLVHNQ